MNCNPMPWFVGLPLGLFLCSLGVIVLYALWQVVKGGRE